MKDLSIKKLYYSISEVSKITGLEQYVLRYWENEFEELKPSKNRAGNRIYTNKDIHLILFVKKLLRDEKYTIDGAKQIVKTYNFTDDLTTVNIEKDIIEKDLKSDEIINNSSTDKNLRNDLLNIKKVLQTIYAKL